MRKKNYTKRPLDLPQQIQMLKSRGLIIDDESLAERQLQIISYFRLAGYLRPMESDKTMHLYKSNSHFDNAVNLYYFDKELRSLLFTAIQSAEIAMRAAVIRRVSLKYGSFWFMNASIFSDNKIFTSCLSKIRYEIGRTKEDFIQEHFAKYNKPKLPPVWKTLEVVSFGTLSRLYCNLTDNHIKKQIARDLGLPQHLYLESWLKSIAALRNSCAHHNRVWNRLFPVMPQLPIALPNKWISVFPSSPNKLYSLLCCLAYLENIIHPNNSFVANMKHLLESFPNVCVAAMGFPKDWQEESLWK